VDADDRTVIVPTETAILTLSTCYPFRFIGNAPRRFIVTASLVDNQSTNKEMLASVAESERREASGTK
jgi:sortase (surface protein transpeptidase)